MRNEKNKIRRSLSLLLLASFLITLCYTFGPSHASTERKTNIYSIYSVTAPTPVKETDPVVNMVLQLFLITSLFVLVINAYRPKSRKPLLISCFDRNHFYHHVTIHAP
jgi:hypothetical protein